MDFKEKVEEKRRELVDTLLKYIETNPERWERGWYSVSNEPAFNPISQKRYKGLNAFYLYALSEIKGYKDPRWLTFKQAKDLGANVKQGEHSANIFYWNLYDKSTKQSFSEETVKDLSAEERDKYFDDNVRPVLKYYQVFNADQCDNMPKYKRTAEEQSMAEEERAQQNALIERVISNSSAPISYGGNQAYYSPSTDSIRLPEIKHFKTMQDYYATALHEIAHSTGHQSRLNRDLQTTFGTQKYAKEELRAELASIFMQIDMGISIEGNHFENHASYLASWLKAVKKDVKEFYSASAEAEKISEYVAKNYAQEKVVEQEIQKEEHKEKIENKGAEKQSFDNKSEQVHHRPLIVNFYAGPGAGKTTAAYEVSAALKKAGFNVEYVPEYAKELVLEKKFELLKDQQHVIDEQYRRLDRFRDSVDIIVTDSPLLLGQVYGEGRISEEYHNQIRAYYDSFDNFNLWVTRGDEAYQQAGRVENLEQAKELDGRIKAMMKANNLYYCNYNRGEIAKTVNRIKKTYTRLYGDQKEENTKENEADTKSSQEINNFRGEHYFLSNFYETEIDCWGHTYRNAESAFQAMKDPSKAEMFVGLNGKEAKKLGRTVELRNDWEENKENIMYTVCLAKFTQNKDLEAKLLATGDKVLIEGNNWGDTEWGVSNGVGENLLGKILMRVRDTIKEQKELIEQSREMAHSVGLPYSEKFYDGEENSDLDVYDGSMSVEDYNLRKELENTKENEIKRVEQAEQVQQVEQVKKADYGKFKEGELYFNVWWSEVNTSGERRRHYNVTYYQILNNRVERNVNHLGVSSIEEAYEKIRQDNGKLPIEIDSADDNAFMDLLEKLNYVKEAETIEIDKETIAQSTFAEKYLEIKADYNYGAIDDDTFNGEVERLHTRYKIITDDEYDQLAGQIKEEKNTKEKEIKQVEQTAISKEYYDEMVYELRNRYGNDDVAFNTALDELEKKYKVKEEKNTKENEIRQVEQAEQVQQVRQVEQSKPAKWREIELNKENIVKEYEKNVSIRVPEGEYSSFVFLAPKKTVKTSEQSGMVKLAVKEDGQYQLKNNGLLVELNGLDLCAVFAGEEVGKSAKRVAPSYQNNRRLMNIEENVPEEMKNMANWCVYKTKWNEEKGKKDKTIFSPLWRYVNLKDSQIIEKSSQNTVIKVLDGEYANFEFSVPTESIKKSEKDNSLSLSVKLEGQYQLKNNSTLAKLTGKELCATFGQSKMMWGSIDNPETWASFDTAMDYARENNCDGLSFAMDGKAGISCIDLDKCIVLNGKLNGQDTTLEEGEMNETAKKLISELNGYCETSVSGNGLHFFLKDDILSNNKYKNRAELENGDEIEVYDDKRFMSITGNIRSNTNELMRCPSATMSWLREKLGTRVTAQERPKPSTTNRNQYIDMSDSAVIERIKRSKKGSEFEELYRGGSVIGNRSQDDLKMLNILAFFTNGDAYQVERIFKQSGLYRPEKEKYLRHSIEKACSSRYGSYGDNIKPRSNQQAHGRR